MGMQACGANAIEAPILSENIFGSAFSKNISDDDVKDVFKSLGELTPANRRIRLAPRAKTNIRAYNAWIKHIYRLGRNPSMEQFHPQQHTDKMLEVSAHMKRFTKDKKSTTSVAEPDTFDKDTDWRDWSPTVINYFRMIAGSEGVPLSYILRENDGPDPTPNPDFKDDYVMNAPLIGTSYVSDAREVHAAIRKLITGNTQAEAIIKPFEAQCDGRADWKALKHHYEGVGIYSADIAKASHTISNLYYAGEKDGRMWWTKFQTELDWAFATYTKRYGVQGQPYHPNEEKLKILLDKVSAGFLANVKASIKVQLTINNNYPYEQACLAFRTEVNAKHPQGISGANRSARHIRQTSTGRGGNSGRGNGGFLAKKVQQFNKHNNHDDEEMIKLKNGTRVKYHASFNYPDPIYNSFTNELKDRMRSERTAYNKKRRRNKNDEDNRVIKEMRSQMDDMRSVISELSKKDSSNESRISEMTTDTPFGGRTEQSAFRRRQSNS